MRPLWIKKEQNGGTDVAGSASRSTTDRNAGVSEVSLRDDRLWVFWCQASKNAETDSYFNSYVVGFGFPANDKPVDFIEPFVDGAGEGNRTLVFITGQIKTRINPKPESSVPWQWCWRRLDHATGSRDSRCMTPHSQENSLRTPPFSGQHRPT